MQGSQIRVASGVTADQVQRCHRDIEAGPLGVFQCQEFSFLLVYSQRLQSGITPHTVLQVDHGNTLAQLVDVLKYIRCRAVIGAFTPPPLGHAIAKQLRLANQGRVVLSKIQPSIQGRCGDGEIQPGGDKCMPVLHRGRG